MKKRIDGPRGRKGENNWGPDIAPLFRKLLWGYNEYFSRGVLNSDGRRLFETIARMIVYEKPWYKGLVSKVRKNPTLENVLRLAEEVIGNEAREIIEVLQQGPYEWKGTGLNNNQYLRFKKKSMRT